MNDHVQDLVSRYLTDSATEAQMAELNALIAQNPEVRTLLMETAGHGFAIAQQEDQVRSSPEADQLTTSFPSSWNRWLTIAACLAVLLTLGLFFLSQKPKAENIAKVVTIQGEVDLPSRDGLRAGDTIRTHGLQSKVGFEFPDGTQLYLGGQSVATLDQADQKKLILKQGSAFLEVSEQPQGKPLVILTPSAELTVKGTAFSVYAGKAETQLEVSEGAVEFKRLSDGRSVQVDAGRYSATDQLQALAEPEFPSNWHLDLTVDPEKKIRRGTVEKDQHGKVIGVRAEHGDSAIGITTEFSWNSGHFAYFQLQKEKVLKVRLKMDHPEWFNLFVLYRPSELGSSRRTLCLYQKLAWWKKLQPGEWRTIEVPLESPRDITVQGSPSDQLPLEWYATTVNISSGPEERGLVVDKIWIE